MDIVLEGKITGDERMDEVIETVAGLKTVPNAILRITCAETGMQGRVGFSQASYIIGAQINNTGETGYSAVRKLLAIKDGNYAILDPGRKPVPGMNQSLWMRVEKVIASLPQLPEAPEVLMEGNPEEIQAKAGYGHVEYSGLNKEEKQAEAKPTVLDKSSKARQFDPRPRQNLITALMYAAGLIVAILFVQFGDKWMHALRALLPHV